jgi:hypothetical protein
MNTARNVAVTVRTKTAPSTIMCLPEELMERVPATIQSLKPIVTRQEAIHHFTGGMHGLLARWLRGSARSTADLFIPYRLFRVVVRNHGRQENRLFAIDNVEGVLDLFEFREIPTEGDLLTSTTRNVLPNLLSEARTRNLLLDKVRRLIFLKGFARLLNLQLEATAIPGQIYFPYWICFRGNVKDVSFDVLDAVRRRPEGARLRSMIDRWLRSESSTTLTDPEKMSL